MERGGKTYYYHADHLGSIVALTDETGATVQKYDYDSYGNLDPGTTIQQPYAYTSREWDSETGLYYYRARYYDPKAGRFISKDPIGFAGGINLYGYIGNNPVNWIDPEGFVPIDTIWDAGNIIWDILSRDWSSLAIDAGAMIIPYVPAGITKLNKVGDAVRTCKMAKAESPVWKNLEHYRKDIKTSGTGRSKRYYTWDHTHGDIVVFDRNGKHLGSIDPRTGLITKPAVSGRTLE